MTKVIFKGDSVPNFLTISVKDGAELVCDSLEVYIGNLPTKTYTTPTFPLNIGLTKSETMTLAGTNNIYVAKIVGDSKTTFKGLKTFTTQTAPATTDTVEFTAEKVGEPISIILSEIE